MQGDIKYDIPVTSMTFINVMKVMEVKRISLHICISLHLFKKKLPETSSVIVCLTQWYIKTEVRMLCCPLTVCVNQLWNVKPHVLNLKLGGSPLASIHCGRPQGYLKLFNVIKELRNSPLDNIFLNDLLLTPQLQIIIICLLGVELVWDQFFLDVLPSSCICSCGSVSEWVADVCTHARCHKLSHASCRVLPHIHNCQDILHWLNTNCSLIDAVWNTINSRMPATHQYQHQLCKKLTTSNASTFPLLPHQFAFWKSIELVYYMMSMFARYLGVTSNVTGASMKMGSVSFS